MITMTNTKNYPMKMISNNTRRNKRRKRMKKANSFSSVSSAASLIGCSNKLPASRIYPGVIYEICQQL